MTTSDQQWAFLQDLAELIRFAKEHGYKLTGGELHRPWWVSAVYFWRSLREHVLSWLGDLLPRGERIPTSDAKPGTSRHNHRMAVDLNLFVWEPAGRSFGFAGEPIDPDFQREGKWQYVTATRHHLPLGEYWESLSPYNRWGGRFVKGVGYVPGETDGYDGNHYERIDSPREGETV